jgi:hypothetical protein
MPDPYVQGPLIMQTPAAAALAEIFVAAAQDLWDAACEEETPAMWENGRLAASRVLAVCHRGEGELARRRQRLKGSPPEPGTLLPLPGTLSAAPGGSYLPGLTPLSADPG